MCRQVRFRGEIKLKKNKPRGATPPRQSRPDSRGCCWGDQYETERKPFKILVDQTEKRKDLEDAFGLNRDKFEKKAEKVT
jgi:hypothetical protein